jgi:hypothetical protein
MENHDRAKLESLMVQLKDFINGLYEVVLVPKELQDITIHCNIASILEESKLRIVNSPCEETPYPIWSEMVNVVIEKTFKVLRRQCLERC